MSNRHTTILEFEVYGKRNIDALREALNKAGVQLELVETQASETAREVHNLSAITRMATARLDNLSASQRRAISNIIRTSTVSAKANAPWIRERQIVLTQQQIEAERRLRDQVRETERANIAAQRAETRRAREQERESRRQARLEERNRRTAEREAERAARQEAREQERQDRANERARRNAEREAERARQNARRTIQRMAGMRGGGGGADLMGKSVSGPLRVVAYDLVRRSLTEIYSLANKIGRSISNWIVDGVKFNDELARSQAFFTSLGILGFKGVTGDQMTIAEASVSKDPKVSEMYRKSVDNSETVMRRLMSVSAQTGQDLGEIVSATRQSMTDLLNKLNKEGKPGAYLQNIDTLNDVTERMVKLASVLRMADPQNRKLSFHMVGLQELFSGTTGTGEKGKKESAGLQNVRSLLMREGIKIGEERAREITQYVNTGNLTAAMDVVQDALERSGLGFEQLSNMMSSTLQPAIDGTLMYLRIFNKIFTEDLYKRVMKPFFQSMLSHFSIMERNKTFVTGIEKLGRKFSDSTNKIIDDFAGVIDTITMVPDLTTKKGKKESKGIMETPFFYIMSQMNNVIDTIAGGAEVMYAIFKVISQFMLGLMGSRDGKNLKELAKNIEKYGGAAKKFGQQLRDAFEWMIQSINKNKVEFKLPIIGEFKMNLTTLLGTMLGVIVAVKALRLAFIALTSAAEVVTAIRTLVPSLGRRQSGGGGSSGGGGGVRGGPNQPGMLSRIREFGSSIIAGLITSITGSLRSIISGIRAMAARATAGIMLYWNVFIRDKIQVVTNLIKGIFSSLFNSFKKIGVPSIKLLKDIGKLIGPLIGPILRQVFLGIAKIGLRAIPYVGLALLIADLLSALFPDIFKNIGKNIQDTGMAVIDSAKKSLSFKGIELTGLPSIGDMAGIKPPEPKYVVPKRPLVLKSEQSPVFNINNLNLNNVQNPAQLSEELTRQTKNKGEQIPTGLDPSFNTRR